MRIEFGICRPVPAFTGLPLSVCDTVLLRNLESIVQARGLS